LTEWSIRDYRVEKEGTDMSDTSHFKFCTSCGAKLNISDRFCTQCGTPCKDLAGAVNPAADGTASFIRGHQLLTGQGMKKDFVAAQQAFHDAAAQGHKEAPFWESICQHYIEVVQLRQQADAMHRQLHPEDVHGSQAAALAGVAPATPVAQAAPHDHDNNNHGDQRHDRRGGSGSNWGKYAAGAVVGAAAASLLHGAGGSPAQAASPDESSDAAYDPGTQDDTADTDVPYEDSSADTGNDDSYSDSDDSSSDDSYSSDDSGGSSDGGGFFDDLFGGGGDDNDGGGFFGGGDDGGGFFGGGDDDW